jgi:guanylate kinase
MWNGGKMGHIFYVMGKSSSGKDTLFQMIRERIPKLQMVTGYTTRPKRDGETEGKEYFFVSENHMEKMIKQGIVIENRAYQTIYGIWNYFTADDGQINKEKNDYLLIGTLESYEKIRTYFGKEMLIPIYIQVEDGVRLKRAVERERQQENPKYAEVCRRFLADEKDFSEENIRKNDIQKRFENVDLNICLNEICDYINQYRK